MNIFASFEMMYLLPQIEYYTPLKDYWKVFFTQVLKGEENLQGIFWQHDFHILVTGVVKCYTTLSEVFVKSHLKNSFGK